MGTSNAFRTWVVYDTFAPDRWFTARDISELFGVSVQRSGSIIKLMHNNCEIIPRRREDGSREWRVNEHARSYVKWNRARRGMV